MKNAKGSGLVGMLDEEFLGALEYAISKALSRSLEKEKRRCWCDGIELPEPAASGRGNKEIITQAWIDNGNGQELYQMRIHLGDSSGIPEPNNDEWIDLDIPNKSIYVRLL